MSLTIKEIDEIEELIGTAKIDDLLLIKEAVEGQDEFIDKSFR